MSDERVPVVVGSARYRNAVAELPVSTRLAEDRAGAIVVVAGEGDWGAAVAEAAAAGARAVIVADPDPSRAEALEAGIPVLVERPLLPDALRLAIDAPGGVVPRLIVIEAAAAPDGVHAALRDAVGWARVLGGRVEPGAATRTGAFLVATGTAGAVPVSITVTVLAEGHASHLRVTAIGSTTTELAIDPFAGVEQVEHTTADGRVALPARFESAARVVLRRAVSADQGSVDLQDLLSDEIVAAAILGV